MYVPTLSFSGVYRKLRIAGLPALLFGTSTGVVLAANPGCQVAVHLAALRTSMAITRKVHHSAATLARWKIGAAAWSKAHYGRVYRGHPPAQTAIAARPSPCACGDIELESSTIWPMLGTEALPEFSAYASGTPSGESFALDLVAASNAPAEEDQLTGGSYSPSGGGGVGAFPSSGGASPSGGGGSPDGPVGSASLQPGVTSPHSQPPTPKHPTQEVTLLPGPLPSPVIIPTPEPSPMILLGTGIVALGVCKFRRQSAY